MINCVNISEDHIQREMKWKISIEMQINIRIYKWKKKINVSDIFQLFCIVIAWQNNVLDKLLNAVTAHSL